MTNWVAAAGQLYLPGFDKEGDGSSRTSAVTLLNRCEGRVAVPLVQRSEQKLQSVVSWLSGEVMQVLVAPTRLGNGHVVQGLSVSEMGPDRRRGSRRRFRCWWTQGVQLPVSQRSE